MRREDFTNESPGQLVRIPRPRSITTKQLADLNSVAPTTAKRQIDALVNRSILVEATGRKRDRVYVAPGVLAVFQTDQRSA
jgi:Fic family protein